MKTKHSFPSQPSRSIFCLAAVSLAGFTGNSLAQPVFITPPPLPPSPPAVTQSSSEGLTTGTDSARSLAAGSGPGAPLQWRKIVFRPHLDYEFMYGTGILIQTNQAQDTFVHTISPGMAFDLGSLWTLDYTPSIRLYSNGDFKNVVDHSAILTGQTAYQDWNFGLNATAEISNDPQSQTGTQTEQQIYSGALNALRQLNGSLSLDLNGLLSFRLTDQFNNSQNYSSMDWLNQQFGPNLGAGIGLGLGYENVEAGSDMIYEQIRARVIYHLTGKIELSVNGGVEIRQFLASSQSSLVTPITGATVKYQMFEQTSLTLDANRSVGASYFENQVTEAATLQAAIHQRLLGRYALSLSGGYTVTSYHASSADVPISDRKDEQTFVSARVGTAFLKRGSISIYYTYSQNSSDQDEFAYDSNQAGLQVGYSY